MSKRDIQTENDGLYQYKRRKKEPNRKIFLEATKVKMSPPSCRILKSQHKHREGKNSTPTVSWTRVLEVVTGNGEYVSPVMEDSNYFFNRNYTHRI